ncbi:MAG: hypothetical protein KKA54_13160 [Proteobacteria bacterium]|nr:hypothetical protein [Pseudomonadota bacterium]
MNDCQKYDGPDCRQKCDYAEAAAKEAVRQTFAILGVDVDNPKEVEQFRMSLRFSDGLRKFTDKGIFAIPIVLVAMMLAAFIAGLKLKLGG